MSNLLFCLIVIQYINRIKFYLKFFFQVISSQERIADRKLKDVNAELSFMQVFIESS